MKLYDFTAALSSRSSVEQNPPQPEENHLPSRLNNRTLWRRRMKNLLLFSLFSLSLYIFISLSLASPAYAQGTYTCTRPRGAPCVITAKNCAPGYVPGSCTGGSGTCVPNGTASCVASGVTATPVPVTSCAPQPFSPDPNLGIMTGLGCVPTKLDLLVSWTLRAIAGIAGGIALLLLFYGGIMFITAAGDPKAMEEAKGIITAAVSGLLLILLSVFILRVIGINILNIPAIQTGPGNGITVPGP